MRQGMGLRQTAASRAASTAAYHRRAPRFLDRPSTASWDRNVKRQVGLDDHGSWIGVVIQPWRRDSDARGLPAVRYPQNLAPATLRSQHLIR